MTSATSVPSPTEIAGPEPETDWLLGWAPDDEPAPRDRRAEALRLFLPGGLVLALVSVASVVLTTVPLQPDDAGAEAAPRVERRR